jgi:VanZ family protein
VSDDPGVDRPLRQAAHVAVYGVLTVLLAWGLTGRRYPTRKVAIGASVLALLYGVSDEWHQTLVPTRTGRAEDLVWDALGAAIAAAVIVLVGTLIHRDMSAEAGPEPGRTGGS